MLEDIGNMRVLPNMSIIVPADAVEAAGAIRFVAAHDEGPVYVRLARAAFPVIHAEDHRFEFGKAEILAQGTDVSIAACGLMVSVALEAREVLAGDGIAAEVINVSTIKPLDRETLLSSAGKTGVVVTAEEHQIVNGLGSAVCELLSEELPTPVVRVGVDDRFGQSGNADALLAHYGLDVDGLVAATKQALSNVNR
jgi:transketolase